jgi:hypothetical protein
MPTNEPALKCYLQELKVFILQLVTVISNEIRSVSHQIESGKANVHNDREGSTARRVAPSKADENKGYDGEDDDDTIYGSDGFVDERQTNANHM